MPASRSHQSQAQAAWTGDTTFATVLLVLAIDTYGTEICEWDPETLQMEIQDDFNVVLPRANMDRLMTAIQLLTTNDFYKSLPDFNNFCNILSGDTYDPQLWDPAEAAEIAWGITEALLLSPPDDDDEEPFTDEIRAFIGATCSSEGLMNPPDILRLALREGGTDQTAQVQGAFVDDPVMFASIYKTEAGKTQDINTAIRQRLAMLSQQLGVLQLRSGNTVDAVRSFTAGLSNTLAHQNSVL